MSNPGTSSATSILPSITGNPTTDRLIRSVLLVISGGLTAWILAWLKARGYSDPNIELLVPSAVFSGLTALAVMVWGYLNGKSTEAAAKQILVSGVVAGIEHANDPTRETVSPAMVSPKVAEAIVETYVPKT